MVLFSSFISTFLSYLNLRHWLFSSDLNTVNLASSGNVLLPSIEVVARDSYIGTGLMRSLKKRSSVGWEANPCNDSVCAHNFECIPTFNSFFCNCSEPYYGQRCEIFEDDPKDQHVLAPMVIYNSPVSSGNYIRFFIFAKHLGEGFLARFESDSGFQIEVDAKHFVKYSVSAQEVCRISIKKIVPDLDLRICDTLLNESMHVTKIPFALIHTIAKGNLSEIAHDNYAKGVLQTNRGTLRIFTGNRSKSEFEAHYPFITNITVPQCKLIVTVEGWNSGFCQECGTLPCLVSFSATSLKHIKLMEVQFSAVGTVVETLNHLTSDSLFKGTGVMKEMPGSTPKLNSTQVSDIFSMDSFSLDVGNYTLFLKVQAKFKNYEISNTMMCWFRIVSVPMVAKIVGGKKRTVDVRHRFTLDATPTTDPGTDEGDTRYPITYRWSCNITSLEICDTFETEDPVYVLGPVLSIGVVYNFTLRVSSTSPFSGPAVTHQVVYVRRLASGLQITQICIDTCDEFVNPTEILTLQVSSQDPQNWDPGWKFKWTYSSVGGGFSDINSISQRNTPFDFLIVKPDQLSPNTSYIFNVQGGEPLGQAEFSLTTAAFPVKGSCIAEPSSGQAISTEFTFKCSHFVNGHVNGSLNYKFYELYSSDPEDGLLLGTSQSGVSFKKLLTSTSLLARVEGESGMFVDVRFGISSLSHESPSASVIDRMKKEIRKLTKSGKTSRALRKIGELVSIGIKAKEFLSVSYFALEALQTLRIETVKDVEMMLMSLKHVVYVIKDVIKGDTYVFYEASKLLNNLAATMENKVQSDSMVPLYSTRKMIRNLLIVSEVLLSIRNTSVNDTDAFTAHYDSDFQNCKRGSRHLSQVFEKVGEIISLNQGLYADPSEYLFESFLIWARKDMPSRFPNISSPPFTFGATFNFSKTLAGGISTRIQGSIDVQVGIFKVNPFWWRTKDPSSSPVMLIKVASGGGASRKSIVQLPEAIDLFFKSSSADKTTVEGNISVPMLNATIEELDKTVAVYKMNPNYGIQILKFRSSRGGETPIKFVWLENERPTYQLIQKYGITVTPKMNAFYLMANATKPLDLHYVGIHANITALKFANNSGNVSNLFYSFESQTISCRFWEGNRWSFEGCKVAPDSSPEVVHCECHHLSFFSSRILPTPNFIDPRRDIDLFWTMKDNYFVSLYVLGVLIFYFTSLAWAVKADKRDKLKERIILLDDNLLEDEYLYIITVYTGFKPNSGTSANVSVKLVGGDGESKVHVLKSSVRRTQQYGNDDWYLICTSKSLGEITSIQIWHDNSGSSPDWYLWKVEVRDAQTDKSWIFFANRWLAVLQKHECLCLQIAPASLDDVSKVSALSKVNIFFGFKEVHTWLSIFVRHPRATVSRSQRLSLLISLMLNTMFGSLMFYKIGTADDTFYEYEIQLQHIIIALESMFIETLMTSLILYCFNKSKSEDEFSEIPKLITEKPKEETEKKLKLTKEALIELSSSKLREMLEMKPFNPALLEQTPRKGKKKDLWLRMAWFLCIVNIVFCSFFTVWLSLKVGEVKAMAWLTSVIFGLVHGLFITKPLRIVLYGFLLAAVYHVQPNISSYYVNAHEVKIYKVERSKLKTGEDIAKERRKAMYMPPTCEQVKQAQETRRIKEVRRTLFIDLIFKITTLVCMFSILRYIKFGTQYHAAQYVSSVITKSSYAKIVDPEAVLFDEITSQSMFYRFMSHTLSPSVHKYMWFTEETMDKESGWISANNWKLLGVIRLRQRRVEKVPCPSLPFFNVSNCFDFDSEYTDDHEFSWNDDDDTFASQPSDSESMWHFQEAQNAVFNFGSSGSDIDSGGYIASLGNNLEDTERVLSILESSKWIDDGTQILYVEFVLINPSNDFLSAVKLIVERLSFGLYTTRTQVETAQVYLKSGSIIFLSVTVGLTFLLFLLSWIRILVLINRFSLLTFIKNFWNCADILSAVSLFLVVLIFLFKMIVTNNVIKNYRSDESIQFEEFSRIIFWYKLLMLTIEIVIFLTFIRFLKLLQFFFSHRVFEFTVIAAQQMLSAVYFLAFCVTLYIFSVYALVGNKLLSGIVPTFISNFFNFGPQYKVHSHVDSISFPIILRFVVLVSLFKCVLVVHYYAARRICKLKSS